MDKERVILHCDCNSFFASVETALNPAFKNVPFAVCGNEENRHGIVLAKNDIAKKYGITTAETVYSARKKCPELVIGPPHYSEYIRYSQAVSAIYNDYTDHVEPFGIDESWLDVTGSRRIFGSGENIAHLIKERVKNELNITVSIGVSFNKVFAKLGSDYKKPDAVTVISRENFKDIVFPLPASDLLFVGKRTAECLLTLGVKTIGQLAAYDKDLLIRRFGKLGNMLHVYANGLDDSPVSKGANEDTKSISNGLTFKHDLTTREECRIGIDFLSEEIGKRLREKSLLSSCVCVSIKDDLLKSVQRQTTINPPTDIGCEISQIAKNLFFGEWKAGMLTRTITVSATGLIKKIDLAEQINLFENTDESNESRTKRRKKEETVDKIRQKYGDEAIFRGSLINNDIGISSGKVNKHT